MMSQQRMIRALQGEAVWPPPLWLMRQAGRYLPEYRAVRAQAGSFLDLVYNPKLAAEVTFQPIRRFGFDAAILFSDILVIPDALGQKVRFEVGEGPRLNPISCVQDLGKVSLASVMDCFAPVIETVSLLKAGLPAETALIGFCGAPWTVATYMIAGMGTPDQMPAKNWAYGSPEKLDALMDVLVEASVAYLLAQCDAGADILQIFDSWASALDDIAFERFICRPTQKIVAAVKDKYPHVPIIGFPKGVGNRAERYVILTGVDAISLDWTSDLVAVCDATHRPVQGNMDPVRLMMGQQAIEQAAKQILAQMQGRPFIFNLGHGIGQFTPISAVETLVSCVRNSSHV